MSCRFDIVWPECPEGENISTNFANKKKGGAVNGENSGAAVAGGKWLPPGGAEGDLHKWRLDRVHRDGDIGGYSSEGPRRIYALGGYIRCSGNAAVC